MPNGVLSRQGVKGYISVQAYIFFGGKHISQHRLADLRLEKYIADPAGAKGLVAAVTGRQGVAEFAEYASTEPIVSVYGADAGRSEHTSNPRAFFQKQHGCAAAGRLQCRGTTACTRADYGDVELSFTRKNGRQEEENGRRPAYRIAQQKHIFRFRK